MNIEIKKEMTQADFEEQLHAMRDSYDKRIEEEKQLWERNAKAKSLLSRSYMTASEFADICIAALEEQDDKRIDAHTVLEGAKLLKYYFLERCECKF